MCEYLIKLLSAGELPEAAAAAAAAALCFSFSFQLALTITPRLLFPPHLLLLCLLVL